MLVSCNLIVISRLFCWTLVYFLTLISIWKNIHFNCICGFYLTLFYARKCYDLQVFCSQSMCHRYRYSCRSSPCSGSVGLQQFVRAAPPQNEGNTDVHGWHADEWEEVCEDKVQCHVEGEVDVHGPELEAVASARGRGLRAIQEEKREVMKTRRCPDDDLSIEKRIQRAWERLSKCHCRGIWKKIVSSKNR